MTDGNALISRTTLPAGSGSTTWAYPIDLERDTPYKWRAAPAWVRPSAPGRRPRASSRSSRSGPRIRRPALACRCRTTSTSCSKSSTRTRGILSNQRSCQEEEFGGDHVRGWEFLDKVVDALRLEDTRWGYMWKRGVVGDASMDVIVYNYSAEPDEGTADLGPGHCRRALRRRRRRRLVEHHGRRRLAGRLGQPRPLVSTSSARRGRAASPELARGAWHFLGPRHHRLVPVSDKNFYRASPIARRPSPPSAVRAAAAPSARASAC